MTNWNIWNNVGVRCYFELKHMWIQVCPTPTITLRSVEWIPFNLWLYWFGDFGPCFIVWKNSKCLESFCELPWAEGCSIFCGARQFKKRLLVSNRHSSIIQLLLITTSIIFCNISIEIHGSGQANFEPYFFIWFLVVKFFIIIFFVYMTSRACLIN